MPKYAIVHEWFDSYAGSERCVESFNTLYPEADVFALVNFLSDEELFQILKGKKPHTSFIQNLPFARKIFRSMLPLFPYAVEQHDLSAYDIIISSSHAVAKGVLTNSNQLHISYCHTPMRYAWDLYYQYMREAKLDKGLKAFLVKYILHKIRIWDVASSNRVDYFIANSKYVARRIKKIYNRDADVIYPPVDVELFPLHENKDDYYLTASRLVSYKKIDVIVKAFSELKNKKLVIIGDGPELSSLKKIATPNIEFLGYQSGKSLVAYMQRAKAFVFAADEDFGITVVEALSCGTPVIALNYGGTAETIIHKQNGIHYNHQNEISLRTAIHDFEQSIDKFNPNAISLSAQKYSRTRFEKEISEYVELKFSSFNNGRA
ncbi:MAG: glycosyltransferase [Ignavibacteriaceae bacterium]|nr:glycosyltransferase [Ignavibacteriaceae bacterium]